MTRKVQTVQPTSQILQQTALLALSYVLLIFLLPANQTTLRVYHLSSLEYRTIMFAVALPALASWFAAFIGYNKLRQYVATVRKTPDGSYFDKLATGCGWLAWSLPIPTLASFILNAAADTWPGLHATAIIIGNYLSLLLALIAFSIIGGASRGLVNRARLRFSLVSVRAIIFLFLTAGVFYCYLIFRRFDLASPDSTQNAYFLPVWLAVVTVIIPYLYAWFIGLLAVYEINLFSRHSTGVLYRQALRLMVGGLTIIIISSVALQYISSVTPRVGHLVLDYRLVLVSSFRLIEAGGFMLLTMGASRLKRIEEI